MSSTSLSITDQLIAPITFNRENLSSIGNDDSATITALIIIVVNSIIAGLSALSSGAFAGLETLTGGETVIGGTLFIIVFIFQLLFLLFISFFIKIVGGWFGAKGTSTMQVFRMIGFASLWTIISSLLGFVITIPSLSFIFLILTIVAFSVGFSAASGIGTVGAFFAGLIGGIISYIVIFIIFVLLFLLVFAAILF